MINAKFSDSRSWNEDRYFIPGRVYRFRTPIIAKYLKLDDILIDGIRKTRWISSVPYNTFIYLGGSPKSRVKLPKVGVIERPWCEEVK